MKKKIIVTGSSGMIGTAFCEKMEKQGASFLGMDKKRNRWNIYVDAVTTVRNLTRNLGNNFGVDKGATIVHLAANARVYDLVKTPDMARDNILMTYNMLEFARRNGIKRFIFASSREVYGNTSRISPREEQVDLRFCESPYTASKMASEALVHAYANCYGIDFIIIRFSNVYGAYDYNNRVVPLFIARALKGLPLEIFGASKMLDFTYIDDAVDGLWRAVDRFDGAKGEVYNIASGVGYLLGQCAEKITSQLFLDSETKCEIKYGESRTGEVTKFVADISKARAALDYEPRYDIDEGLERTIKWYKPRLEEYLKCLKSQL